MNLSETFVRRPIATSLLMAGILLVGIVAWPRLPVAPLPQVDFPTIEVSAQLPGASPPTMAASVATPLEHQFAQIAGLTQMTSSSTLGSTTITLQFELNRNIDAAAQDVQAAISAAAGQLPRNMPAPPSYAKINPADAPILVLALHSAVLPLTTVDYYAEDVVAQQISQIDGVSQVNIGGQQKQAVRIQVDPIKLAALGLQLPDIANVVSVASVNSPKGAVNGTQHSFAIYDNDQLDSAAPWNNVIVAYKSGAPVRIRDIGRAVNGPQNTRSAAWQDGKPGIFLLIYKQPGANVIQTVDRIDASLPKILVSVPPSLSLTLVHDRTATIKASVDDVEITLTLTITLVILVIFMFLRSVRTTLIPAVTVPLSLGGTAALMYLFGFSLDNLSLMALTIAVTFVVDDAIVMLENIYRHIEEGLSPMQATLQGAREIGFTILSMSLSLMAVFIPLLLMSGVIGRLFREFALTVVMTIAMSAFIALTLSPMMCSRFVHSEKNVRHGRLYLMFETGFDRLLNGYRRGLDAVLRHPAATMAVFAATAVASVALYILIPKGFFPQEDTGVILAVPQAAQDVSFDQMVKLEHSVTNIVARDPAVAHYATAMGLGGRPLNSAFLIISLKPRDQRKSNADQIIRRLEGKINRLQGIKVHMQSQQDINVGGRTAAAQYQYTLTDTNLDELNAWAPRAEGAMRALPELSDVASDQQTGSGMLSMRINRDQAARFGIQPAQIDDTLEDAFGQAQVGQYFTQTDTYPIILEVTPSLQRSPRTLDSLYLRSPLTGQMVPLSTLVRYDTQHATYLSVAHQGEFPAVTLSFNLASGVALGNALTAIERAVARLHMPASISGGFQGTAQVFQSSLNSEIYLILAAIAAVYIVLGMLYESYVHPLTILSTLPSAGTGALLVLMLFHFDLSVIALIGIILLIGLVKKNGIMMVDFAITAEREQHLSPEAAIRQACLLRFRPIMMTTMAALLGAVPLMLSHGTGSELRQPLGYTMVGGLLVSQSLTLFTTPVVYLYLSRWTATLRRARAGGDTRVAPTGYSVE